MKFVKGIALSLLTIIATGIAAIFLATAMADNGMLGSCFEGACGYAAIYGAFPALWLFLLGLSLAGYLVWSGRRA